MLACPRCAARFPLEERFCGRCGMPLVYTGRLAEQPALGELQLRARKIMAEYTHGDLVRVAGGRHQAEAELIQSMLLEEGIPSIARRSAGFDVPDFLAAGPRDILVPESGARAARELLHEAELAPTQPAREQARQPLMLVAVVAGVVGGALLFVYLLWLLLPTGG